MKESIGSTVLLYVFMILFFVIISIMAITINFALTFQKKNRVITTLERCDGNYEKCKDALAKLGCTKVKNVSNTYNKHNCEIAEKKANGKNIEGTYYQVVVFVKFSVPIMDKAVYFPIHGETSIIGISNTNNVDEPKINKSS